MHVWTITTIRDFDARSGADHRVVGIIDTRDRAVEFVEQNVGDIYECGWYPFAVIEKYEVGHLYPICDESIWFKWNRKLEQYDRLAGLPAPVLELWPDGNICNWGIG